MPEPNHVAVIGAGISGLACAYRLQQLGLPVTLFESENHAGGLMGTVEKDGFLFESGPQSFQGTETILDLIRQLGVESELCKADPRAPRWVLQRGKLQKIPMSPQGLIASSLLGAGSRWKIASEPFRRTKAPSEDESVADFVRRKFGHEILEYLVSPFVSGVYAGDPEKLSLRAAFPSLEQWEREYGSVIRGAMKSRPAGGKAKRTPPSLCSFRCGVQALPKAIADQMAGNVRFGTPVKAIRPGARENTFEVCIDQGGAQEIIPARGVVLATPAFVAAHLMAPVSQNLSHTLSGIAYAGVAVAGFAYFANQIGVPLEGFGVLVPRSEKLRTLGTVWNSSLFPERARKGSAVITSFVGGATDSEILAKSEDEIAAIVQGDNSKILQITGPPVASAVWKHPKALPQYNLGHHHVVQSIRDGELKNPGLFFSGNYLEGPSLGKCIEHGFKTADAVHDFVHRPIPSDRS